MKHKNIGQKNKQKSLISNNQTLIEKNSLSKNIVGFLIFFIIILIIIPYYLFKHDNYEFLSMYLPNVDIIATVLSFKGGFFTNHLFSELYPENMSRNPVQKIDAFFFHSVSNHSICYIV